jgi:hypothetical protein
MTGGLLARQNSRHYRPNLIDGKTRPLSRSENLKDTKDAIGARLVQTGLAGLAGLGGLAGLLKLRIAAAKELMIDDKSRKWYYGMPVTMVSIIIGIIVVKNILEKYWNEPPRPEVANKFAAG